METNTKRGFTLMELLVVIAIIGILASVVLASLSTARSKGNDAKVKAQLASIRASAEIYYDNQTPPSYGTATNACDNMFADATSGMAGLTTAANYPNGTTLKCVSTGSAYAVSANLNTANQFWCVDSTGASKQTGAAQADADPTC